MMGSRSRFFVLLMLLFAARPAAARQATTVDDAAIRDADAAEWLSYGRDYGETHHSPLDLIDAGNVDRLGLEWFWDIEGYRGRLESTPLVSDGVLYATGVYSVVFAVDARTGEEIWRWDPAIVQGGRSNGGPTACCGPVNRGVAIYDGKVYAGLLDGRLVALDAETGHIVWSTQTTPLDSDYTSTGAPRIVNGNVILGNGGAEYGVRGYVTAYDALTGDQVWRTYTVPGDPSLGFESLAMELAADTWAGQWWELGGGGTAWDGMAFDPEANLLYIGTGNGSPWSRQHRSGGVGDNLYLSSILALDADTGELIWYYQTSPGDDWDYTAVQNIILADIEIAGAERQVLMQAPKNGFFYVLDRITGELISAEAYAEINWATGVDLGTGRPIETPAARYDEVGSWLSPGPLGAHNWTPMAFSPLTGLVYLPASNGVSFYRYNPTLNVVAGQFNTGTGGRGGGDPPPRPETPQPPGYLSAWDPATQQEVWRVDYESSRNSGVLTTGGNLVFSSSGAGLLAAYDDATGEQLWQFQMASGPATPMTYVMDGIQYLTILSGPGGDTGIGGVWTFVLDGDTPAPDA